MRLTLAQPVAYACLLVAVAAAFYFRPYPYADDWAYALALGMERAELLRWIVEQHVDHYIPLQKVLHTALAVLTGFDFRVLLLSNLCIAFLTAILLLRVAQMYRGRASWGDIVIPLGILNLSAGYTTWVFQFQFLSSTFFSAVFLYCLLRFGHGAGQRAGAIERPGAYFHGTWLALAAMALCGMNGAVSALVVLLALTGWYVAVGRKTLPIARAALAGFLVPALLVAGVILTWNPSGASLGDAATLDIAQIYYFLQTGSLTQETRHALDAVGPAILITMLLGAVAWLFHRYKRHTLEPGDVGLLAVLLATQAVLLSVALGRAVIQGGWSGIIALHYGPLGVLSPLLIWILLSRALPRAGTTLLAIGFVVLYAHSYAHGVLTRVAHIQDTHDHQATVSMALKREADADRLMDKHVLDFTWRDEEIYREDVMEGLQHLREAAYPLYGLMPPFRVVALSAIPAAAPADRLASAAQLANVENWQEAGDYERTTMDGHVLYGSFIQGDMDKGTVRLHMRRGQSVVIRTGPVVENQKVGVLVDGGKTEYALPPAPGYTLLVFDAVTLPERFELEFRDDGDGFGEWSAVLLKR